jgi:hypothetical protein
LFSQASRRAARRQPVNNPKSIRVIASAAKQSMAAAKRRMDCFGRFAPRNDGVFPVLCLLKLAALD